MGRRRGCSFAAPSPVVCRVNDRRYVLNRTLVIDVGKNFLAAAVEWFPKYGLREIDAVLITHAHADGVSVWSQRMK